MQFYLAPLEGVTGHVFREAYDHFFHDIDKYFTPFIPANDHLNAKTKRELQTVYHVEDDTCVLHAPLVPQILGNRADAILAVSEEIAAMGDFDTINLNFGCPSGTVTGKNRGAGVFKDLIAMDEMLDHLFRDSKLKISLKTRIGWADEKEWEQIVKIFADYPFSEIIIHPRVRADQYRGECRTEAFAYAMERLKVPLGYNGDIDSVESFDRLCRLFPKLDRVMIGRGIVKDPFLVGRLRAFLREQQGETDANTEKNTHKRHAFVTTVEEGYLHEMQNEKHAVMRMKEFWLYFSASFPECQKAYKALKKSQSLREYRAAASMFPW